MSARAWSMAYESQLRLADLGTRAFLTVGTTFFELGPELRRVPELSRGLPRARLRGITPKIGAIAGRWPDRAFLAVEDGDGRWLLLRWKQDDQRWVADPSWPVKSDFGSFYVADLVVAGDTVLGRIDVAPFAYASEGDRWRARAERPTLVVLAGEGKDSNESICFQSVTGTKTGAVFAVGASCSGGYSHGHRWATPSSDREELPFEDPSPMSIDAIAADDAVASFGSELRRFDGVDWTVQPAPTDTVRAWLLDGGSMLITRPSGEYGKRLWRLEPDGATKAIPLTFGEESLELDSLLPRSATDVWAIGVQDVGDRDHERYVVYSTVAGTTPVKAKEIVLDDLAAEEAEREAPESFTDACVDQSLWLLGEAPKANAGITSDDRKRAETAAAWNGVYEEVTWHGKRYRAVESRFRMIQTSDADYRALRDWAVTLGASEQRHYCRFFPRVVRRFDADGAAPAEK